MQLHVVGGKAFVRSKCIVAVCAALGCAQGEAPPGGPGEPGSGGALGVVTTALTATQEAKFQADPPVRIEYFGSAVAMDGTTALVGHEYESDSAIPYSGATYVYVRESGAWSLQGKLTVPAPTFPTQGFGHEVDLEGDVAVVGAPHADITRYDDDAGAVYEFVRAGATWTQAARINGTGSTFADAIDLDGDELIVGSSSENCAAMLTFGGAARVFVRGATGWTVEGVLLPSVCGSSNRFGSAVAIDGDTAVVGARWETTGAGYDAGAVYVFTRTGTTWSEQARLEPTDPASGAEFGFQVAITGETVVVGSPDAPTAFGSTGAVYVFERSGAAWTQTAKLAPFDATASIRFGWDLDFDGGYVLVGAPWGFNPTIARVGSAYLLRRTPTGWLDEVKLVAADGAASDEFGRAVAFSADLAIVGSPYDDASAYDHEMGAAYLFRLEGSLLPDGSSCAADDACAGGRCVDGVCCDADCGGGVADCQACSVAAGGLVNGTCGPLAAALAPTVVCRAAAGSCDVEERCAPTSTGCPADGFAPDGTACDDGLACDGVETCTAGACASPGPPECDDDDPCTVDTCAEPLGCANEPLPGCGEDAGTDDAAEDVAEDDGGVDAPAEDAADDETPDDEASGDEGGADDGARDDGATDDASRDDGPAPDTTGDVEPADATDDATPGDDAGGGCGCSTPGAPPSLGLASVLFLGVFAGLRRGRRAR